MTNYTSTKNIICFGNISDVKNAALYFDRIVPFTPHSYRINSDGITHMSMGGEIIDETISDRVFANLIGCDPDDISLMGYHLAWRIFELRLSAFIHSHSKGVEISASREQIRQFYFENASVRGDSYLQSLCAIGLDENMMGPILKFKNITEQQLKEVRESKVKIREIFQIFAAEFGIKYASVLISEPAESKEIGDPYIVLSLKGVELIMPIRLPPKAAERRSRHSCHTAGCSHAPSYSPA